MQQSQYVAKSVSIKEQGETLPYESHLHSMGLSMATILLFILLTFCLYMCCRCLLNYLWRPHNDNVVPAIQLATVLASRPFTPMIMGLRTTPGQFIQFMEGHPMVYSPPYLPTEQPYTYYFNHGLSLHRYQRAPRRIRALFQGDSNQPQDVFVSETDSESIQQPPVQNEDSDSDAGLPIL